MAHHRLERGTVLDARSLDGSFAADDDERTIVRPRLAHVQPRARAVPASQPSVEQPTKAGRPTRRPSPHVSPARAVELATLERAAGGMSPQSMPVDAARTAGAPSPYALYGAPAEQLAMASRLASGSSPQPLPSAPNASTRAADEPRPQQPPQSAPAKAETVASAPEARATDGRAQQARGPAGPPPVEVFSLIRRIALQRDLANAAGVLQAGLGELIAAHVVLAQIQGGGSITSPHVADLRAAAKLVPLGNVAETARRKQRFVAERVVMVPLGTTTPTVLIAWRTPRQPAFDPLALKLISQLAARLTVLDHFLALAAQANAQAVADQESVFRPEALAAARGDRRECELVDLSPRTLRIAIPLLGVVAVLLVVLAAIVQVPTYSRGTIVVKSNGSNVISNTGGRIASVYVAPGQRVSAGDPIVALDTTRERQDFEQVDTVYRDQLSTFLFDTTDEAARHSLAGILAQRKAALDALTAKTITAPVAGTVSDVLVNDLVQPGEHVATIVPDNSSPSVLAFMPGIDRSRIRPGMTIQVELTGYPGRLPLTITEVGTEIMGQATARKFLGQKLADAVALPASVVLVKAALPSGSFESRGKTYSYFDGMDGIAEIEVDSKSFLSVVIPTGDR